MRQIFAARWVLPVDAPTIDDGEVVVEDGVIQEVRQHITPANEVTDLGNAVLMPGLVNAHTHLEYTALRGFLEDVPFFPWIRTLTAAKAALDREDWMISARLGAAESIASGVTTIGDNTDAGVTAAIAQEFGLRAVVFQEFFGIDPRQERDAVLNDLRAKLAAAGTYASDRVSLGISPHAPYTVRAELLDALLAEPDLTPLRTSIHVAESPAEVSLIREGTGPFAEMFVRREIPWTVPRVSPTHYLADHGAVRPGALLVHCVHQDAGDIALIARTGAAIVHCPKSNAKLGAGIAPLSQWLATEGVTVALGTDSAVSNNTLDLFEEMRFALLMARASTQNAVGVTAQDVLRMATLGGAAALGLGDITGSLTPGKRADLTAVSLDRLHTHPATSAEAALVYSARADDVVLTVCDGNVLFDRTGTDTARSSSNPHLSHHQLLESAAAVRLKFSRRQNEQA